MAADQAKRGSIHRLFTDMQTVSILIAVVETQSVTLAAHRLGIGVPAVSKRLSDLEARAGVRLINRTTRRIAVTDLGLRLYERCKAIAQEVECAEADIWDMAHEPAGRLRITAPSVFGSRHIAPMVAPFLARHPKIGLDVLLTAQTVDMVQEGIDLSIRIARDIAPPFGARRLAPIRRVFCAAPDYLVRAGTPADPDDLTRHNCLLAGTDQPFDDWPILRDGRPSTVKVSGNLMTNSVDALHQALLDGAGIAFVGTFLVGENLKRGKLVEILAGQAVQGAQLFAVTPHHRFTPRKVEVFIDHVAECLGSPPYWDR